MHGQVRVYDVVTEHIGRTEAVLHCPTRRAQVRVKRALVAQGYAVVRLRVVKLPASMRIAWIDAPGDGR